MQFTDGGDQNQNQKRPPNRYAIEAETPPDSPHYQRANAYKDPVAPAFGEDGRETAAVFNEADMADASGMTKYDYARQATAISDMNDRSPGGDVSRMNSNATYTGAGA